MIDELAQHGERSVVLSNSLVNDIACTDDPLQSRSCEQPSCRAVVDENSRLIQANSCLRDEVSRLKEALRQASRRADYDALTGLPNRRLLLERFTQASVLGERIRQQLALLFLDLDNFKGVNDRLGHAVGDQLLLHFAERLSASIRASDTACRYGGDEFIVLQTEIDNKDSALTAANAVLASLAVPYHIADTSIRARVSFGIAICPDDGIGYTELMRHSDRSMFRNKALNARRRHPQRAVRAQ